MGDRTSSSTLSARGLKPLAYRCYGEIAQPVVMLLHGLGADWQMFHLQIDPLVQAGFCVLLPDLPGHGASAAQTFSFELTCQLLLRLLDEQHVQQISLIGVSMGGLVAQQLACSIPQRCHKLVLVDSFSSSQTAIATLQKRLAWLLTWLPKTWQGKLVETTYRQIGHPQVGTYFNHQLRAMPSRQFRHLRNQVNAFDIEAQLTMLDVPTLVLVGDQFGQFAIDLARRTATQIPHARFQVLEGGGDPSNLLVPEAFNTAVLAFLQS